METSPYPYVYTTQLREREDLQKKEDLQLKRENVLERMHLAALEKQERESRVRGLSCCFSLLFFKVVKV